MNQNYISYRLGAATGPIFVNFAISELNDQYRAKAQLENDKPLLFDAKKHSSDNWIWLASHLAMG